MESMCCLLLLMPTLLTSFHYASSEISGVECCNAWSNEGWTGLHRLLSSTGPCYNGIQSNWTRLLCNISNVADVDLKGMMDAWTLNNSSERGQMLSPAMSGDDGELCVSAEVQTVGSARLIFTVEDIAANAQSMHLADIIPQKRLGDWQRLKKIVTLPERLRRSLVRLVVAGDQADESSLVLVKSIEFCNTRNSCGVAPESVMPLIAFGSTVHVGQSPWFAGIFKRIDSSWKSICGGTLVREDIVISVAHCFYSEKSQEVEKREDFTVSVGKYFRDWDVQEVGEQRSPVLDIILPENFLGSKLRYEHDIGIIRVIFAISPTVVPICVDFIDFQDTSKVGLTLQAGQVGLVHGWGRTESKHVSPTLRYAQMQYIPFIDCVKAVPDFLSRFIVGDKLCAGNNRSALWNGDSGGGLTFSHNGRWYLRGIASTGIPEKNTFSLYTDLHSYQDFLKTAMA